MKTLALLGTAAFVALSVAQLSQKELVGNWEGESTCVNYKAAPNCHNEHVIYHVMPIAKKPNQVRISADKVINNKPDNMGEFDYTIDSKGSALNCDVTFNGNRLLWHFSVKGDKMTGTLMNGDKVVVRRITLTAQKKA